MNVTAGEGVSSRLGARLVREVVVPVPAYRRVSSLIGLSLVLVLMASAVDAVVWTYQSQRRIWREEAAESMRPVLTRRSSHVRVHPMHVHRVAPQASPAEGFAPASPPHRTCLMPAAGRIPR